MKDVKDIEDLLRTKSWVQLTREERDYVLTEIDSEEEYDQLRDTFMMLSDADLGEGDIDPDPAIKRELMSNFQEESPERFVWLNAFWAWLFPAERSFYQKPAFQLATVVIVGILIVSLWNDQSDLTGNQEMAQELPADKEKTEKKDKGEVEPNKDRKTEATEEGEEESTLELGSPADKSTVTDTRETASESELDGLKKEEAGDRMNELDNFEEPIPEASSTTWTGTMNDLNVTDETVEEEFAPAEGYTYSLEDRKRDKSGRGQVTDSIQTQMDFSKSVDQDVAASEREKSGENRLSGGFNAIIDSEDEESGLTRTETGSGSPSSSRSAKEDDELLDLLFTAY